MSNRVTVASLKINLAQEIEAKNLALKEVEELKAKLIELEAQAKQYVEKIVNKEVSSATLPDWAQALVKLGFSEAGVKSILPQIECKPNGKYWILLTDQRTQARIAAKLDELKVQKWLQIENGKHKVNFLK